MASQGGSWGEVPQLCYLCLSPNSHQPRPAILTLVLGPDPVSASQMATILLPGFPSLADSDHCLLRNRGCHWLSLVAEPFLACLPLILWLPDHFLVPALISCLLSLGPTGLGSQHSTPRADSFSSGPLKIIISLGKFY